MGDVQQNGSRQMFMLLGALLIAFFLYAPDGILLWNIWMDSEEFNHGPLMLAVAGYLAWKRKDMLSPSTPSPSWTGLMIVVLAIMIYLISIRAAVIPSRHYSFLLLIYGFFIFAGGRRYGAFILPSLVLLFFVVPPPAFLNADLTWGLQLFSSDVSVKMLRSAGISVFQDGNIIDLGVMKLEVAEACAGLRYLYPMMGLGILAGMLFNISWRKRTLFFLIASVVAILMNSVRIFVAGLLVDLMDISVSEGFFHLFEGWVYFIISFAITLALCRAILSKTEWDSLGEGMFAPSDMTRSDVKQGIEAKAGSGATYVLITALLIVPMMLVVRGGEPNIPDRKSFASFPLELDGRRGREDVLPISEQQILQMADYFLGHYRTDGLAPISLFIGYYETQTADQTPHSPRVCIPSGGWKIDSISTIELAHEDRTIPVNRVVIAKGASKQLVYYWFQQRGKFIASEYEAKINLLWGGIVSSRTDGALVRLVTPVGEGFPMEAADQYLEGFSGELLSVLPAYLPD